jgi:glutathione S-transferase
MVVLCGFGVSNYHNKLKLALLEKQLPFQEEVVYPWQRDSFLGDSPLGKIPFLRTPAGGFSESQVIFEYLEEAHPELPLYPAGLFERARCREFIQHLELNCEWVARRLYKQAFFGGQVSQEIRDDVRQRLPLGLQAAASRARLAPFMLGDAFTAADCAAICHLMMIRLATQAVYGEDLVAQVWPGACDYLARMADRPSVRRMLAEREQALLVFQALGVPYDG